MQYMKFKWQLSLSIVVFSIILAGCSPSPVTVHTGKPRVMPDNSQVRAENLLYRAAQEEPDLAAQLTQEAANIFVELNQPEHAYLILSQIEIEQLSSLPKFDVVKLQTEIALQLNQPDKALEALDRINSDQLSIMGDDISKHMLELRLQAFQQNDDTLGEIKTLIKIALLEIAPHNRQVLHNSIWNKLQQLKSETLLAQTQNQQNNYYEQGWFELAWNLTRNTEPSERSQIIADWSILWDAHPAKNLLPNGISPAKLQKTLVGKVAVLLPQQGALAKPAAAIREGITLAYLREQQEGMQVPELVFLDSSIINNPDSLAEAINTEQIDLIIGPLNKTYVTALATATQIDIPILALNRANIEDGQVLATNFYQFGLSSDDEARQISMQAWQDGVKYVAILAPETLWGQKAQLMLNQSFKQIGGQVVSQYTFANMKDFPTVVSMLLATDKSKGRLQQIKQIIGYRRIKFEEYHRQDIGAIFLVALPNDARQLKSILAFNFAGDIPIYATSHIYSGIANPVQDEDLNGTRFLGTPWTLKPASANRLLVEQKHADTRGRFGRLYALGLDAYLLHPYLQQLNSTLGAEIEGETGRLSINNGIIKRNLIWARFSEGIAQLQSNLDKQQADENQLKDGTNGQEDEQSWIESNEAKMPNSWPKAF